MCMVCLGLGYARLYNLTMAYYQEDTLSIASRQLLAELLAETLNATAAIEDFRESLAAVPHFDSLSLFRLLDRQQKGFLAEKDLEFAVGTSHRKLLTYAFSWLDVGKAGEVSRFEFAAFLLPRDNLALREGSLRNLQESQVRGEPATLGVQFEQFQDLLKELMGKEMKLIDLRRKIISQKDYSVEGVRFALTNCDRQWVCAGDIYSFMQNMGFQVSQRQTDALVQMINRDGEGRVTTQELQWLLEGIENKDKSYLERVKAGNKKKPFPKPTIEEHKLTRYFSAGKKKQSQTEQEFSDLMDRIKTVEQQQHKHEKLLLQSQKGRIQSARKAYQQQLRQLQLKRQVQSARKAQERQAKLAQHKLQLQLDELLLKTARLEQDSERLVRQQNRMAIMEDSVTIKRENQAQLCAQEYERIAKTRLRQRLVFSPPHTHEQLRRMSIESHMRTSQLYLNDARYAHQRIMRDRKQQSLIFNKENEAKGGNKKKTPGTLLNKSKQPLRIDPLPVPQHTNAQKIVIETEEAAIIS